MKKRALAAAAAAVGAVVAASAHAGVNLQGPQLTGMALQSLAFGQPIVTRMTLPSGEIADLRWPIANRAAQRR